MLIGRRIAVPAFLLVVAATCALLLVLPRQTVTTRYLDDLLILDEAYRVTSCQIPDLAFHTPLGPLTCYLLAAGYFLLRSMDGTMPAAMALVTLALSIPIPHAIGSRLHATVALLFGGRSERAGTGLQSLCGSYIAPHDEGVRETDFCKIHRHHPETQPEIGMHSAAPS